MSIYKELMPQSSKDHFLPTKSSSIVEKKNLREKTIKNETVPYFVGSWLIPLFVVLGISFFTYTIMGIFDLKSDSNKGFTSTLFLTDPASIANAIGSINELLAAILAIVITVVAIVVQLAAQRYSPKLVDMFIEDRVNTTLFAFMVFCAMYSVLVTYSVKSNFYPIYAAALLIFLVLLLLGVLMPYFNYVFTLLTPVNIIGDIRHNIQLAFKRASGSRTPKTIKKFKDETASSMEQITDTILTSISHMDRNVAIMALNEVKNIVVEYLNYKDNFSEEWFTVSPEYFIGVTADFHKEMQNNKTWLESKAMIDMELIFKSSLVEMPDAVNAIALNTRLIGSKAVDTEDYQIIELSINYFNTFLRISNNAQDQKVLYNLFYQYRLMTNKIFLFEPRLAEKIFFYFKYYGQLSINKGIWFIYTVATYDVGTLVAQAYKAKLDNLSTLLSLFLKMDNFQAGAEHPPIMNSVRKAQLILLAFLNSQRDQEFVPQIVDHLQSHETKDTLLRIRDEVLAIEESKFWEITDRGINFEFIDEEQKASLKEVYKKYIE